MKPTESIRLVISPLLAAHIGLNKAIVLRQLHYWLGKSKNIRHNRKWVYNSYRQWQEQFPFWSQDTIQRIFTGLERDGYIVAMQLNKHNCDHRKWYTIDYARCAGLDLE